MCHVQRYPDFNVPLTLWRHTAKKVSAAAHGGGSTMDMPVSKWKLWADVIIGWLLIATVVVFIKVAIPRLQKRALSNDPRVPAGVQWTALGNIWGGDVSALT